LRRVFGLRFLVEAAFIALVAALAWYEDVPKPALLAAIAGAWFLVALAEWLLSRREREAPAGARHVPGTEPAATDMPPPAQVVPLPAPEPEPPPVAEPEPEPEPPPAAEPEPVVTLPASAEPREWNLWELERVTREAAGADAARDEERSFLLMYLREFADPDGMLPVTFDPLVRETFGDVLGTVRP
jgi:outer membrane biosynthesis protein TonB